MKDLLPGYVRGTLAAGTRAAVAIHLEACADCRAEVELIEAASTAYPAPGVDIGSIVGALPRAPHRGEGRYLASRFARLAAAIAIVATGALSVIALRGVFAPAAREVAAVPARDSAVIATASAPPAAVPESAARTRSTPKSPAIASGISFGGGLSDLSEDQLDTLLGELGALEALPSAEPETHLTPVVPEADGGHSAR